MRVRRTLAALLAVPWVLVAACGGGSSVADPPISSAPTSSPTPSPAPETAEHFIRRWAAAEKKMENTGETGPYLAISRGCRSCRQLASDVSRFYAAGGFVRWGGWQISSIRHYANNGPHRIYSMRARSAPTAYKESASGALRHLSGGLATDLVTVIPANDSWHVVGFTKLGQ